MRFRCATAALMFVILLGAGSRTVMAGGGPENVLLVVNAGDESSRMVANWYQRLRNIPDSNVVFLADIPRAHLASFEQAKSLILMKIMEAVQERKLDSQIDYIVYSTGFPTQVDITEHSKKFMELWTREKGSEDTQAAMVFSTRASLTSFTYFFAHILNDDPTWLGPASNNYFRKPVGMAMQQPFGGQVQEDYEKAVQAIRTGKADEAIGLLETLSRNNQVHMIVLYRLAQAHAIAYDADASARALVQAARAGWCYRKFTEDDPLLKNVIDSPLFSGIVKQLPNEKYEFLPTVGGSARYPWGPGGVINSQPGQGLPYLMCTMLGTNWDRGNSEKEIILYLNDSVKADYSRPKGTFYFSLTADIRTTVRQPGFQPAVDRLAALGYKSEIGSGILPHNAEIAGASIGTPGFSWQTAASNILPGAICENFTSFGGDFTQADQTKLSELMKYGAAGSSGTVAEPFALQFKFPDPMIHVHYVRGCSLAESYYQSVAGPFQLLIVGDAICQPWAKPPKPRLTGLESNSTAKGQVTVQVTPEPDSVPFRSMEVFFDGKMVARHTEPKDIHFDSTKMSDGYHELRIVVIDSTPIQTRAGKTVPFKVDNSGQKITLEAASKSVPVEGYIELTVASNVGSQVEIVHAGETVGRMDGHEGKLKIEAVRIGRGPVQIFAVTKDDGGRTVSSDPVELEITGDFSTEPVSLPTAK